MIAHNLRTETVAGGNGDDGKLDGGQRRLLVTGAVWLEDSDQLEPKSPISYYGLHGPERRLQSSYKSGNDPRPET